MSDYLVVNMREEKQKNTHRLDFNCVVRLNAFLTVLRFTDHESTRGREIYDTTMKRAFCFSSSIPLFIFHAFFTKIVFCFPNGKRPLR